MLCLLSGNSLSTIALELGISSKSAHSTLASAFCKVVDHHRTYLIRNRRELLGSVKGPGEKVANRAAIKK
jgi:DNA-binding CsgD family transcriptional regulator